MSELEPRLRSAMWYKAGSGWSESSDWLVWAFLSRDWTIAWRRQVIHCCLLKESLACRLYVWALERPLLLTRKQFFTVKNEENKLSNTVNKWTYNSNNTSLCSVIVSVGQHWCVLPLSFPPVKAPLKVPPPPASPSGISSRFIKAFGRGCW